MYVATYYACILCINMYVCTLCMYVCQCMYIMYVYVLHVLQLLFVPS